MQAAGSEMFSADNQAPGRGRPDRVHVEPLATRSALNRVQDPAFRFRWSLNPYRGCQHACIYCYARVTHTYLGLDGGDDFDRHLLAKLDMPAQLARELSRPRWRHEQVAVGTATDPYQPAEARYRLTRQCLALLQASGTPASITTKNPLVLRDLDILTSFADEAPVTVNMTITTLREDLWRLTEPGTPHPLSRLEAVRRLYEAGVRVGVLVAPIMPGLTDDEDGLRQVAEAAADAGAGFLWPNILRLDSTLRLHLLPHLAAARPDLTALYQSLYGAGNHLPRRYADAILERFHAARRAAGLDEEEICRKPGGSGDAVTAPAGSAAPTAPATPVAPATPAIRVVPPSRMATIPGALQLRLSL